MQVFQLRGVLQKGFGFAAWGFADASHLIRSAENQRSTVSRVLYYESYLQNNHMVPPRNNQNTATVLVMALMKRDNSPHLLG